MERYQYTIHGMQCCHWMCVLYVKKRRTCLVLRAVVSHTSGFKQAAPSSHIRAALMIMIISLERTCAHVDLHMYSLIHHSIES